MLNDNQIYQIYLEDYSKPRYISEGRPYFGTMDDIIDLMVFLEEEESTRIRYAELADAISCYDGNEEITHVVNGRKYPLLTEVNVLARHEIHLGEQHCLYTGYSGASYPIYADSVEVCQILVQDEMGYLVRCIKVSFTGLQICAHGIGWYIPGGYSKGFPGMITRKEGHHIMNMYVTAQYYAPWETETALKDLTNAEKIDLTAACKDILGDV